MQRITLKRQATGGMLRGSFLPGRGSLSSCEDEDKDKADGKSKKVFVDAEEMKAKIREQTMKPVYNVAIYYHTTGIWQKIARNHWFEQITLGVIALNALWISIDTDLNTADVIIQASPVFQCAEHFFCLFFAFEWFVRFMSFKRKRNAFRDSWFIFDSVLVSMMVLETWVMCIIMLAAGQGGSMIMGNAGMLRMARLMRLSRVVRMARLFRAMPQLLIVIKALVASLFSCVFVFLLLIVITYVFGIALRQLTAGYQVGQESFQNVPQAMYTLWVRGTILDEPHAISVELWNAHPFFSFVFWMFSGLSALLIMNMLIGVLCEVVTAVSGAEKERYKTEYVKGKLQEIMQESNLDQNRDGQISKSEFSRLLEVPKAHKALSDVGVDVFMLVDNIDFIFSGNLEDEEDAEEVDLTFEDFMALVLELRGTNTATVNDVVDLKKYIKRSNANFREELRKAQNTSGDAASQGTGSIFVGDGPEKGSNAHANACETPSLQYSHGAVCRTGSMKDHVPASRQDSNRLVLRQDTDLVASTLVVDTLRQEFNSILQQSLIPELSKVCTARQVEIHEELCDLIAQLRREFAKPPLPQDVSTEIVFTESTSPSMRPPYSEVPLASGGGILNQAKKSFGMDAQSAQTFSPRQAGPAVNTKDERRRGGSCPYAC